MKHDAVRYAAVSVVSVAFWVVASAALNTPEAWDSPHYLAWYLAAIGLAAAFGWVFEDRAWRWGALVVFGQLPVMLFHAGLGPLLPVGLGMLALQAIPAGLASMMASKVKTRWMRGRR